MRKKGVNKLTVWLMVVCMLAGMVTTVGQPRLVNAAEMTAPWAGSGTEGDPYEIYTAEDLATVSEAVYEGVQGEYLTAHFRQMADIDLSVYENWAPIGGNTHPFDGTYDGGGYTISNLTINDVTLDINVGLFGFVGNDGMLKNIRLENANISSSIFNGFVGSLAGRNLGTVTRTIGSQVDVTSLSSSGYVGGLVGFNAGTINESYCGGTVNADGAFVDLGGFVGLNYGSLLDSYSTCSVTSARTWNKQPIGGFVGVNSGVLTSCYYNRETSGQLDNNNIGKGTPKNTAEMMYIATFSGWDFGNTWKIEEGISYPSLQWLPWTVDEEITRDNYALTWDDIKGNNINDYAITENLILPTAGDRGTTISWSASSWGPDTINTETGEVYRPTINDGDQVVTLTATISKGGGTSQVKDFYLQVLVYDAETEAVIISDTAALTWDSIKGENGEIDNVTGNLVYPLPVAGMSGTSISWSASPTGWVNTDTGVVRIPNSDEGDQTVTLTATVSKEYGMTQTKTFTLNIKMSDWSWQGDGSQGNPYQVEFAAHLNDIRYKLLENGGDVYFIQTADIDLSGYVNWASLGNDSQQFVGTYNGNGFIISNLTINNGTIDNVGLFGYVGSGGTLEKVKLKNVDISSAGTYIGGLAGYNSGTISNSSSSGSIECLDYADAGGLVGDNYGTIGNSSSNGSVVGLAQYSSVGGLVGYCSDGTIIESYSTANVTGGNSAYAGGLVGDNYVPIVDSYSIGEVTGGDDAYVGGLIGYCGSSINNNYSTGKVTGGNNAYVGGLIGYFDDYDGVTVGDSYYNSETSGQSDTGYGTPKTTCEMKQEANFIINDPPGTWDFVNTWRIIDGYTYPNLQWETLSAEESNILITFDKDALGWDTIKATNSAADNVTENLNLISSGANDTTITWSSSPTGWINTNTGVITRPSNSQGDKPVTLTAAISKAGGTTQTKDFTLTIKAQASTGGGRSSRGSTPPSTGNATVTGGVSVPNIPIIIDAKAGRVIVNLEQATAEALFEGEGAAVLTVPSIQGVSTYTLEMPASILSVGQGGGGLAFSTDSGSITIPDNMLTGVTGISGKKAGITIGQGDKSLLPDNVKEALGGKPLVQLALTVDSQPVEWNNPNAPVTVSVLYTPTAAELQDAEHIVIWYIDGAGNVISVPSGRYNAETGMVTFTTTHFSQYAVAFVHNTFNDLGSVVWAKKPIEVMASKGITNGTGKDTYSPGANITRADYLVLLVKTLGLTTEFDSNFNDVKKGTYYYEAAGIAKKLGITAGSGNNRFHPNEYISRQDIMVLTAQALEKLKKLEIDGTSTVLDEFKDRGDIAGYAKARMASLVREKLIAGSGGKLNPKRNTTRAEAAVFLYGMYNK